MTKFFGPWRKYTVYKRFFQDSQIGVKGFFQDSQIGVNVFFPDYGLGGVKCDTAPSLVYNQTCNGRRAEEENQKEREREGLP